MVVGVECSSGSGVVTPMTLESAPVPLGQIGNLNWVGVGPRVWEQGLGLTLESVILLII